MYISQDQWGKFIILVLDIDDILLASNEIGLLQETNKVLSKTSEIKALDEESLYLA